MWPLSARKLPIMVLLILPSLIIVSHFLFFIIRDYYMNITIFRMKNVAEPLATKIIQQDLSYVMVAVNITSYIQYGIVIMVVIVYPLYPYVSSAEGYFKRRGYENVVFEYELIMKIFYFSLPFFIVAFPLLVIGNVPSIGHFMPFMTDLTVRLIIITVTVIGAGALLKILCLFLRKEFRYYFAKGCSRIVINEKDEFKRLTYLDLLLDSYNKYLQRTIKVQLKDLDKIYSKLIYADINKKDEFMLISISKTFEGNTFDLLRLLSATY
jgi:hypothetical protein